ncbi:helix-turn-helix domain-containing protein [Amycolatopsis lurida]|uniref:Transposase IS30-like HTH domain-containing protein n=1 Tax=Amycolatopsis lurida NRRL 2430 TaxID=1460371 RepID=A0A2P2FGE6_AMYLU|nr:helix-turn-helix domain-containing protein [Amycolatopsis lurida]KFU75785.1 hypothetical protein BB31_39430 [Amycolatopsis lurida NRRL 2430]
MLTLEEDVEAQALRAQGWSVSAIARHLGRDRKTIRRYLAGDVVPGKRRSAGQDPFEPFVGYCRARLADDLHLWAATLLDEIAELGYPGRLLDVHSRAAPLSAAPALRAVSDFLRP